MGTRFVSRVVRNLLLRLPAVALTALPILPIHAYLLVIKNEGFNGFGHWTAYPLNVWGNSFGSTLSFFLGSTLLWSIILSLLQRGPAATWQTIKAAPRQWLSVLTANDAATRLGVALGLAAVLLSNTYFGVPRQLGWALGLSTLLLGMGYPGMLVSIFISELLAVLQERFPWLRALDVARVTRGLIAGIPTAYLLSWGFSSWTTDKVGLLALIYLGYQLHLHYKAGKGQAAATILALASLFGLARSARADDGGWAEATGNADVNWANIVRWWNSQGSLTSIAQGAVPAVAAAAGTAMAVPLAPPTGGLDLKEDVTQTVTEGDQEFEYGVAINRSGSRQIPADGRSRSYGYTIGISNNPKVKPGKIARAATFTTTAPPGFNLQIQEVVPVYGGDHLQYTIVAVADPDSAFAPGEIPGVVYAEASSPGGLVRDHCSYTILVGTGDIHLEPLERSWLRADGEDSLQLTAYIEPNHNALITDTERYETLELAAYGGNANWVGVSPPGNGAFYRYWTVKAAAAQDPAAMRDPLDVELGIQGRFAGGLLQLKVPIQVLPPPRLENRGDPPFLVVDHQEEVSVELEVIGRAPKENWELDTPTLKSGPADAASLAETVKLASGVFKLSFRLGHLDPEEGCQEQAWSLTACEDKGATTEEFVLRLTIARPGVVYLSPRPLKVKADGKTETELKLTVLAWNEGAKKIEIDEGALSEVKYETVSAGDASKALEAAELKAKFDIRRGSGLSRHALYKVSSLLPVPGAGACPGELEGFLEGEDDPAFRRRLPVHLLLDPVLLAEQNKAEEWRLIMDVLQRYFKGPYERAEESDRSGNLAPLIGIYDRWMQELERDRPYLGSADLREKRRLILKEAVATWKAIGEGYLGDAKFYENLLRAAVTVDWFVDNAFTICAKAALAWTGPVGATIGSTVVNKARAYLSKFVGNSLNGIPASESYKEITDDLWGVFRDFVWQDSPELLAKAVFGKPGEGGEVEVSPKIKVALLTGYICYRFYRNYVDDDPVTKENPVGFWRATWLTAQDIGMKFAGDAFENYCKTLPLFRGGPRVGDLGRPTAGGSSSGDAPASSAGGDAPAGSAGDGPAGSPGGDAPAGPSGDAPAGSAGGDAPAGPSGDAPAGSSGGDDPAGSPGGDAPAGSSGGDAPAGSAGGDAPAGSAGDAPAGSSGGDALAGSSGDAPAGSSGGDAPAGDAPAGSSGGDAPAGDAPAGSSGGDAPAGPSADAPGPDTSRSSPSLDDRGIPRVDLSD